MTDPVSRAAVVDALIGELCPARPNTGPDPDEGYCDCEKCQLLGHLVGQVNALPDDGSREVVVAVGVYNHERGTVKDHGEGVVLNGPQEFDGQRVEIVVRKMQP